MKLLFDLFPVILFFVAYQLGEANPQTAQAVLEAIGVHLPAGTRPGVFLATLVAILATVLQVAWMWLRHRRVDAMLWVSLALIVVFGGATLFLHDEAFIKWKPTVLYWLFAAVLAGAPLLFRRNLIRLLMQHQVSLPDAVWERVNLSWAAFFAFLGVANLFVAYNYSTDTWVNFKLFGTLGLMLAFIIGQTLYLTRHLKEEGGG
ncbi:MAG: septation protein A [Thiobacillaceae bacterium]|nr:septation protein A [Thiobacillaceae bacterium]MDW8322823.1 septation protein A [Burkholderiales bacterium]